MTESSHCFWKCNRNSLYVISVLGLLELMLFLLYLFRFVGTDGCLQSVVVEFSLQAHRYGVDKCACGPSVLSSIHQGHGGKFALL